MHPTVMGGFYGRLRGEPAEPISSLNSRQTSLPPGKLSEGPVRPKLSPPGVARGFVSGRRCPVPFPVNPPSGSCRGVGGKLSVSDRSCQMRGWIPSPLPDGESRAGSARDPISLGFRPPVSPLYLHPPIPRFAPPPGPSPGSPGATEAPPPPPGGARTGTGSSIEMPEILGPSHFVLFYKLSQTQFNFFLYKYLLRNIFEVNLVVSLVSHSNNTSILCINALSDVSK